MTQKPCAEPNCTEMITGRAIRCPKCAKARHLKYILAYQKSRPRQTKPKIKLTGMDYLDEMNRLLAEAKKCELSYGYYAATIRK